MENQAQIKVLYILILQQNLIHPVKVIQIQPKNVNSDIMESHL